MKHVYTSTALALLFGLGVATAPLTADAAGQQQAQQQQVPGQEQVPGAAPGTEAPTTAAPTAEPTTPPVTAEPAVGIDEDRIMTHEAVTRAEERFDELAEGEDELDEERFVEAMEDVDDPEELFAEIDRDEDGVITREEWREWAEEAFAEADPEGLTQEQYEAWERTGRLDMDEEG